MTKNKFKSFIACLLTMFMCVTMLIGNTFAWFTDIATTGVNNIQSGTLDIDLVDANGESLEGKAIGFVNADENTKWEPGCRYSLETVKLVNKGSLNAKYKIFITATTGDVDLAEVIDVYEGENNLGTLRSFLDKIDGIKEGVIAPGETLEFGTLTLVMQTSAGNEYQGKSITGISITALATQATVESDSFDDQYDAGAEYIPYENILTKAEVEALYDYGEKNIEDAYISGKVGYISTLNDAADWRGQGTPSAFNNVKVEVSTTEKLPTANFAPAILAVNNSTFTDCIVKGTTYLGDLEGITACDIYVLQNQTTKLTGGEYGSIVIQGNGAMIVDGAAVDYIATAARGNTYKPDANEPNKDEVYGLGGGLFVKSGSVIGKIEASANADFVNKASANYLKVVVEEGATVEEINLSGFDTTKTGFIISIDENATVGKIVLNGTEYTLEQWLASGYNDILN